MAHMLTSLTCRWQPLRSRIDSPGIVPDQRAQRDVCDTAAVAEAQLLEACEPGELAGGSVCQGTGTVRFPGGAAETELLWLCTPCAAPASS